MSKKNLHTFEEQFKSFPEGCFRCHLAGITPAGGSTKWSMIAVEFLQDLFLKQKEIYLIKCGEVDTAKKSLPVLMWYSEFVPGGALVPSRNVLHSVNKLLVKNGLALNVSAFVKEKKEEKKEEKAKDGSSLLLKAIEKNEKETEVGEAAVEVESVESDLSLSIKTCPEVVEKISSCAITSNSSGKSPFLCP